MNVTAIPGAGDAATGLRRHVEVDPDARRAPNVFHGQHAMSKTIGLRPARQVRQAAARTRGQDDWGATQAYEARSPAAPSDLVQAQTEHTQT